MNTHVSVPCRSIIQCFATYRTLFTFFRIAHARRSHFLHVVIQLKLLKKYLNENNFVKLGNMLVEYYFYNNFVKLVYSCILYFHKNFVNLQAEINQFHEFLSKRYI